MPNLVGTSNDPNVASVFGSNEAKTPPTIGGGAGSGVFGLTVSPGAAGVFGANNSNKGVGVQGNGPEAGISGFSENGAGIRAHSNTANAVEAFAHRETGVGILAMNSGNIKPGDTIHQGHGILSVTTVPGAAGVFGANNHESDGTGVQGNGPKAGIAGWSPNGNGVLALSNNIGIVAQGGQLAGRFVGDIEVTGDVRLVNADCAEDFDILESEHVEPGTVMVIDETGALQESRISYDKRVAGVISGAGNYKPGIILDKQQSQKKRLPIGLLGKVYCKVDAQYGAIEVGDLLTTSETPGHAMKAVDTQKVFGTVIGKALSGISNGTGLIPILIALQ
ncbi:hypothetical protein DN407_29325 (plasmid) [Bacillus sp. JAS24-2]|uniref:hypothetical protein n=1 Tax=Bacillus sp. JAS24-2 TaxID=2217832 RepID=UPI0011ED1DA9|nr:hypothetical protein [Bacillus sp. JAS24-2]QEL82601.1 hypothetical protein DN407_29325 [Bacillus sp. JAS24-2]